MQSFTLLLALLQVATAQTGGCSQCAHLKQSGKPSCCAPGGAWYNNCGNAGDLDVRHTWVDGMQACNAFARTSSGEAGARAVLGGHETATLNTTQQRNGSQIRTSPRQQTTTNATVSEPSAEQTGSQLRTIPQQQTTTTSATGGEINEDTTDSKGRIQLTNFAVYSSLLFMIVHVQM